MKLTIWRCVEASSVIKLIVLDSCHVQVKVKVTELIKILLKYLWANIKNLGILPHFKYSCQKKYESSQTTV